MPDRVKEKLVELCEDVILSCKSSLCDDCEHNCIDYPNCMGVHFADHLISNGVTVQEWIPVKDERKPKDRKNYFIAYVFGDSDMHFFGEAKYHAYEGNGIVDRPHFSNEGVNGMRVTHWMEIPKLPQPPKGD